MTRPRIEIDSVDHPQVAAALARLGGSGAWERLFTGPAPTDPLDLADVDLLVAVGIVGRDDGRFRLLRDDPVFADGAVMSDGLRARMRRTLRHADGGLSGWTADDEDLLLRQGRSSAIAARLIADQLAPSMAGALEALEGGAARFLDVGVGVAAIPIALCRRFVGLRAVGLDVLPEALRLAETEVADAGLADRIELRQQSVADLSDVEAFDLAWVAQPFIPRAVLDAALPRVWAALVPGGWLVAPVMAVADGAAELDGAFMRHSAHLIGGGPVDPPQMTAQLEACGFVDVAVSEYLGQLVMVARRPG